MTRDYNPKNPIINPLLIKRINEVRINKEDNIFLDFLNTLYEAEFLMPVTETNIVGSDTQLFDFMILQNDNGIYVPIFTNYFEMRKLQSTTKNQKALVTDFYDTTDLLYVMEEAGVEGIVIDPFGINLILSLDFIQNAEQIMQTQKQTKLIKEMHKELLVDKETII